VRALWHALYSPSDRKLQVSFYLGDRLDPEHPGKTQIARSNYIEFALSSPATAQITSPTDEYQAILKDYARKQQEILQALNEAKTEAAKRMAWADYRKGATEFAPRMLRLAESDSHQAYVPEALAWIAVNARDTPEAQKATSLLLHDRANSAKLASVCDALSDARSVASERLLRTVLDQTTDREVRGRATFALGVYFMRRAESGKYSAQEIDADNAKAKGYFQTVIANYGSLKHWQGTLEQAASKNIDEIRDRSVGKAIPDIKGVNVDGRSLKLSDYSGKVVFLDFWATWCPPCMVMVPHERSLLKQMEGRPFTILGVNADKDRDSFKTACAKAAITWPCFFEGDVGGPIAGQFNLYNYPTAYLIDHRGIIRWKYREPPDDADLDRVVEQLVHEAEAAKR
jgi:thiol-disulfide isomerase/thioredoxin